MSENPEKKNEPNPPALNVQAQGNINIDGDVVGGDKHTTINYGDMVGGDKLELTIIHENGKKKAFTPLEPTRMTRAWWVWLFRYRRGRVAASSMTSLLTIIILSALIGIPTVEGWQALPRIDTPVQPLRLFKTERGILLSTFAEKSGCDVSHTLDTGLFGQLTGSTGWQKIDLPNCYTRPNQDPQRAAIRMFTASNALPPRIYAATSDVGILRSNDYGVTWNRPEMAKELPLETASIAVSSQNPELVFFTGQNSGLFRSLNGGANWDQVDGKETCNDPTKNLPGGMKWYALLINRSGVYAGTRYPPTDAPPNTAGLYFSRDDGVCWERIHNAEERYSYHTLAENPNNPAQLLAVVFNHRAFFPDPTFSLWLLGENPGELDFKSSYPMISFFTALTDPPQWYATTGNGQVIRGTFDSLHPVEKIAWVTGCAGGCELAPPDLTGDVESTRPLILADYTIYQWGTVGWFTGLRQANWIRERLP